MGKLYYRNFENMNHILFLFISGVVNKYDNNEVSNRSFVEGRAKVLKFGCHGQCLGVPQDHKF